MAGPEVYRFKARLIVRGFQRALTLMIHCLQRLASQMADLCSCKGAKS